MSSETITVCDACLRAACWKGIFMCDASTGVGTTTRTAEQLSALGLEHSDYWDGTYEEQYRCTAQQTDPEGIGPPQRCGLPHGHDGLHRPWQR